MTDGLRVESELALTLPAPVQDYSATGSLHLYRDVDGSIVTEETGLRFDLEERYGLLNFGEFELTKVHVEVNPFEWTESRSEERRVGKEGRGRGGGAARGR